MPCAVVILSVCMMFVGNPVYAFSAEYEQPSFLGAEDVLPAELLHGDFHKVAGSVHNDGFFNTYQVKTPYGSFSIQTTWRLRQLVHELQVIQEMRKVETEDVVLSSLEQSGKNVVAGVGNLISDPQGAFEGAVSGAQSLFGRAKETIGKREISDAEDSRVEQLVGISKSKGEIATRYGVSVYTVNQPLQDELDRLGRADFAGGLGVGVAQAAIPGVGGALLSVSGSTRLLNEVINTTPASELWVRNKKALLELAFSSGLVEYFLNNPAYSPAQKTIITEAMKLLRGVKGSKVLLEMSLQASSHRMANVVTVFISMTAAYHEKVARLDRLQPVSRFAYGVEQSGKRIVLLPTDHVLWSERLEDAVETVLSGAAGSSKTEAEIWTIGTFSERAEMELKKKGWAVKSEVGLQLL